MNSEHILKAVGRLYGWQQGKLIPEAAVRVKTGVVHSGWGRPYEEQRDYLADLMWVTTAGYATEIEIKVTRADWRADLSKFKWGHLPPWITRFVYAAPHHLGIPDFVPPEAGIIHVYRQQVESSKMIAHLIRPPRKFGKEKVPKEILDKWLSNLYYRYWYQRLHRDHRLPKVPPRVFLKKGRHDEL